MLALAVLVFALQQPACVSPPPTERNEVTRTDQALELPFRPGERRLYRATVAGMDVAEMEWTVATAEHEGRTLLQVGYRAESVGAVNRFRRFELTGTTLMDPSTLRPMLTVETTDKPDEEKTVTVTYDHAAETALYHRHEIEEGVEDTRQEVVEFSGGWDMLSGMMFLRTAYADLVGGEPLELTMLDGRKYVQMVVTHKESGRLEFDGQSWDAERFEFKVRRQDSPEEPPDPWRASTVWVRRRDWVPLQFDAAIMAGTSGTARLVEYERGTQTLPGGGQTP
jgi:hypothetical protein